MIFCNGAPKTGTNILQKLCGMLGLIDSELFFMAWHDSIHARKILDNEEKEIVTTDIDFNKYRNHFCHSHICDLNTQVLRQMKVINSYRDPRNSLISYLRWKKSKGFIKEVNEDVIIDVIAKGLWEKRKPDWCETWVQFNFSFVGWLLSPFEVLPLEFEKLGDPMTVVKVAEFIGVEDFDAEEIADNLIGNGKFYGFKEMYKSKSSYLDGKSKWEDYWTNDIDEIWKAAEGDRLLRMMGYEE